MSRSRRKTPIHRQCAGGGSERFYKRHRAHRERAAWRKHKQTIMTLHAFDRKDVPDYCGNNCASCSTLPSSVDSPNRQLVRWDEWNTGRDGKSDYFRWPYRPLYWNHYGFGHLVYTREEWEKAKRKALKK